MSNFLQFSIVLSVIILAAKLAGYISNRFGQPSVFGELIAGIILGPSLINITHLPFITSTHLTEGIHELAEIGVLMLMFLAGIELHLSELARNTKIAAYAGILGVLVPVGLGALIGNLFGMSIEHALFLGLTLGATSVSISAQTLMELGVLRSRVGLGLLGSAVFDDIIVILLLSTFTALLGDSGGGAGQILIIILRMVVFLAIAVVAGVRIIPSLARNVPRLQISQGSLAMAIVVLLIFGISAELIGGMAAITGAFIAGLMFGRTPEKSRIEGGMSALAYGMFVPIFFIDIGLRVNLRQLDAGALWLMVAISIVGILGKILGSGLGARLGGFNVREALQLGIGMVSRGEVGLIVAAVGLQAGLLTPELFSAIIGMVLVTTLVTPPMLRASFANPTAQTKSNQYSNSVVDREVE